MYLHAGNNKIIRTKSIIGIFDMDNATLGADTRNFLKKVQSDGLLEVSKEDIPKSFILYEKNKNIKQTAVCISQLSSVSIASRAKKSIEG
ncbi:MAG: DUF370 domain-containing protein [Ruminococcaceae bacterium]|nr:DUF370 domain-containing protein [Oscillospiraceae bacterium]